MKLHAFKIWMNIRYIDKCIVDFAEEWINFDTLISNNKFATEPKK